MSLIRTQTFTTGTAIEGADLAEEFKNVRDYINGEIVVGDFATGTNALTTTHIARPEIIFPFDGTTFDYRMTSGQFYGQKIGDEFHRAEYQTSHIKSDNFVTKKVFTDIPGLGKSCFFDLGVDVRVIVYAYPFCKANDAQPNEGNSNEYYLFVDGTRQDETLCYATDLGGGLVGTPPREFNLETDRFATIRFMWSGSLGAGWHTFQVKCNPVLECSNITIRTMIILPTY